MSEPLVTCLCLTNGKRRGFLDKAIDCFESQTYPHRELMIVGDSVSDLAQYQTDRLRDLDGASFVTAPEKVRGIGQKRNMGCQSALFDYIAIWDDDDFSRPDRLENQVRVLQESGKSVTGYSDLLFTDLSSWWRFHYPEGFAAATSLLFRRSWWENHRFNEGEYGMVGLEERFTWEAYQTGELVTTPSEDRMYATIHPGNTSPKRPSIDSGWVPLPGFVYDPRSF